MAEQRLPRGQAAAQPGQDSGRGETSVARAALVISCRAAPAREILDGLPEFTAAAKAVTRQRFRPPPRLATFARSARTDRRSPP
jgi:hypothetical protein